uniref:GLOBIN domain-containing protein n=1 Tax=Steinernema glaseri TaxID=37863 RepID=A0A1I7ZA39_9BILA
MEARGGAVAEPELFFRDSSFRSGQKTMGNNGSTDAMPLASASAVVSPVQSRTTRSVTRHASFGNTRSSMKRSSIIVPRPAAQSYGSQDIPMGSPRRRLGRCSRSQSLEQRSISPPIKMDRHKLSEGEASHGGIIDPTLRQSAQPQFQISGDLSPQQINTVKRTWKQTFKEDEMEIAIQLLLRIFQLDPRAKQWFYLSGVPECELRQNDVFKEHVKAFEPTLIFVMGHLHDATSLSRHLQQLGGRHVRYTGVTYKSSYWKTFMQALLEVVGVEGSQYNVWEAWTILGAFCVEQMRIGYKIEHKLQREAERLLLKHRRHDTRPSQSPSR